ncbi:MAG TPA: methyltransferase domain-containing protein, partial [Bacteroidetes bacterium]|nr:methyltransferase domain-containing protein [Bacteroidota bacterium]
MGLRKLLKPVLNRILPRFARWYLRKERSYRYEDLLVQVPPGVFHPGLYNSTKHLLAHLKQFDLQGKILLEIGAGSGLISIWCARQGAVVTATDLSEAAISAIQGNAAQNQVSLEVVHSDLFQGLTPRIFDFILLNPPFFKGTAQNEEAHAWYAGPEFEYFQRLFAGLKSYRKPGSILRM